MRSESRGTKDSTERDPPGGETNGGTPTCIPRTPILQVFLELQLELVSGTN